jgi:pSer/pThr/pTyr-binding forkhead associated (FHA) protein
VRAQLVCRARPGTTLTFALGAGESVLGREPGLVASLPLEGISRRHAKITWDGRFHWLEDLGSTNGTFLNGRPVRRERLRHLDVITLGKKVDLVFALRSDEFHEERVQGIRSAALHALGGEGEVHEIPPGEVTLGRSSACNVEVDGAAVSTVHARIERRLTQLVIEDLGSSNGTFVNGVRATTTLLHDGDVVSLGGVVDLRVRIELGEVTGSSGARSRADWLPVATARQERSQFGSEWRTRLEWGSGELRELGRLRQDAPAPSAPAALPEERRRATAPVPSAAGSPRVGARATALRPAVALPAASPAKPEASPADVVTPGPPAAVPAPSPVGEAPARRASTRDVARVEAPAPAPIREVRLRGAGLDLVLGEPGAHQIGRSPESSLRIDHPTVSRRHARVILAEDRSIAYLQDLGGANGTLLNGAAIEKLAPLGEGDRIRIGEVELVVGLRRS